MHDMIFFRFELNELTLKDIFKHILESVIFMKTDPQGIWRRQQTSQQTNVAMVIETETE